MKRHMGLVICLVLITVFITSCKSIFSTPVPPTIDISQVQTKAAQDVLTNLTLIAPTFTPIPTQTPEPTKSPVFCASEDFTSPDWVMVNNLGTAKFNPTSKQVEITAIGGNQDLYNGYNLDAPRVIKKLPTGNFEIIAKVTNPENAQIGGFQASGLLLYFNTQNYAWIALSAMQKIETGFTLMGTRNSIINGSIQLNKNQTYLAMKTDGFKLYAGYSEDGVNYTWSDPVTFDTSNIRAGVVVLSAWPESPGFSGLFECFEYKAR